VGGSSTEINSPRPLIYVAPPARRARIDETRTSIRCTQPCSSDSLMGEDSHVASAANLHEPANLQLAGNVNPGGPTRKEGASGQDRNLPGASSLKESHAPRVTSATALIAG
jgi:hypothetical protein